MAGETIREPDSRGAPTQREGVASGGHRTVREGAASDAAPVEVEALLDALGEGWRGCARLEAQGGEADLYILEETRDDAARARRVVAKIYRPNIEPKTEVLETLAKASREHVVEIIDHKRIVVSVFGSRTTRYYELLEYVEHGALEQLIAREGTRLPAARVREVLVQLASAIQYVNEDLDIVHRDIKPSNVLVRSEAPLDLVLADFGIASPYRGDNRRFTAAHRTIAYAAPETIVGEWNRRSDWWSLGIMLVEMLTGRPPHAEVDETQIMKRLLETPVDDFVQGVEEPFRTLCRGLLRRRDAVQNRWGFAEVQRWLSGDATLKVADEADVARAPPAFSFEGRTYDSRQGIATALWLHHEAARAAVGRGTLLEWIRGFDNELFQTLQEIEHNVRDLDERVCRTIAALDTSSIPAYCGWRLDATNLRSLAHRALPEEGARERQIIQALYDSRLLETLPDGTGHDYRRRVFARWAREMGVYDAGTRGSSGVNKRLLGEHRAAACAAMLLLSCRDPDDATEPTPEEQSLRNTLLFHAQQARDLGVKEAWMDDALRGLAIPPAGALYLTMVVARANTGG